MAQVLVRDLDQQLLERLKDRARLHGRSLQGEMKAILTAAAATFSLPEAQQASERWRRRLAGRITSVLPE